MKRAELRAFASRYVLTTLFALVAAPAHAQVANGTSDAPMRAWTQSLKQKFSKCVGPLGPRAEMPATASEMNPAETMARIELAGPAMFSDGYRSTLLIHGPTNAGYIVQIGGYGGTQTVYGPLPLATACAGLPPSEGAHAFAHDPR